MLSLVPRPPRKPPPLWVYGPRPPGTPPPPWQLDAQRGKRKMDENEDSVEQPLAEPENGDEDNVEQPVTEPEHDYTVAFAACNWHVGQMQDETRRTELKSTIRDIVKSDVDVFSVLFLQVKRYSSKDMEELEEWIKECLEEMNLTPQTLDRSIVEENVAVFVLRNAFDSAPQPASHRHIAFDVEDNGKAVALRLGKQVLMVTSWETLGMHTTRNLIAAYLENLKSDELGLYWADCSDPPPKAWILSWNMRIASTTAKYNASDTSRSSNPRTMIR